MVGEVKKKGDQVLYFEWLYDRTKNSVLIMHMVATFQLPQPPMEKPSSEAAPGRIQIERPPVVAAEPPPKPKRDSVPIHFSGYTAMIDVILGGQPARMVLDTGATLSSVTESIAAAILRDGNGHVVEPMRVSRWPMAAANYNR